MGAGGSDKLRLCFGVFVYKKMRGSGGKSFLPFLTGCNERLSVFRDIDRLCLGCKPVNISRLKGEARPYEAIEKGDLHLNVRIVGELGVGIGQEHLLNMQFNKLWIFE